MTAEMEENDLRLVMPGWLNSYKKGDLSAWFEVSSAARGDRPGGWWKSVEGNQANR